MGLAQVSIVRGQFEEIHNHLDTHTLPGGTYRNMHMRESRQRAKKRVLSYFHIMFAPTGERRIEGRISGPDVFCEYQITQLRTGRVLVVAEEEGDERLRERIATNFLKQIFGKITEDRQRNQFSPGRIPGQLYLKRLMGGIDAMRPVCRDAIDQNILDEDFVEVLAPWNLNLFRHR